MLFASESCTVYHILKIMNLSGPDIQSLHEALLSAFPNQSSLMRLVQFKLGKDLDAIVDGEDQADRIFNLMRWADANGKLAVLIDGAREENPTNPSLLKWSEDHIEDLQGQRKRSREIRFDESNEKNCNSLKPSAPSVVQTMTNSPGGIQANGNVTVHNPYPSITFIKGSGEISPGRFGLTATLIFGANPPGPISMQAVHVVSEFPIGSYRCGIVGGALCVRGQSWMEVLSADRRSLIWGDDFVQAGNYMRLILEAENNELGRISWELYQP